MESISEVIFAHLLQGSVASHEKEERERRGEKEREREREIIIKRRMRIRLKIIRRRTTIWKHMPFWVRAGGPAHVGADSLCLITALAFLNTSL